MGSRMRLKQEGSHEAMQRSLAWTLMWSVAALGALAGCNSHKSECNFQGGGGPLDHYKHMATEIDYPDVCRPPVSPADMTLSPLAIGKDQPPEYWDMPLEEAMQLALANSTVLRDLSGVVLRSPQNLRTIQDPAITETDPRFGVEAALSAFDANFQYSGYFEKNDRAINNQFFGGGTRELQQDLQTYIAQLSKKTAIGTELTLTNNVNYDFSNAPGNQFPGAWQTIIDGAFRQPILQGGGMTFNRIAGPNGVPGLFSGVMLARLNTDVSLTDFEIGVRDLSSNVENAYWDLYLAYRYLYAAVQDRDRALEYWRTIHAQFVAGREGVDAGMEATARELYFQFEEDVDNAWNGRLLEGTRTYNGSSGGTLRASTTIRGSDGVRVAERRLRLLIGLPISDGRLIRPGDDPPMAKVLFDWDQIVQEAITRRAELRRQKWIIKRDELVLAASRNYLLPRFDAIGRYRWRGLGQELINPVRQPDPFDNAWQNLTGGDYQEWQLGFELQVPIGFRKAHVTVRNAELMLARSRTILWEQEREVVHDLSNSVGDVARSYDVAQAAFNRRRAARDRLQAEQTAYETGVKLKPDAMIEAFRQFNEIDGRFYIALVEYALAIKNVHFEKGSLLDYNEIQLAEGPWPRKAYADAAERNSLRWFPRRLDYILRRGPQFSHGAVDQDTVSPDATVEMLPPPPADPTGEAVQPLPVPPSNLPEPGPDGAQPLNRGTAPQEGPPPLEDDLSRGYDPAVLPASGQAPPTMIGPDSAIAGDTPPGPFLTSESPSINPASEAPAAASGQSIGPAPAPPLGRPTRRLSLPLNAN
jgi:hypothetical protein